MFLFEANLVDLSARTVVACVLGLAFTLAFIRETWTYMDERKRQDEVNAEFHRLTSLMALLAMFYVSYLLLSYSLKIDLGFDVPSITDIPLPDLGGLNPF